MDKLHRYAKNFIISERFGNLKVRQSKENSFEFEKNIIRLNLRDDEDCGFMRHLHECHHCELNEISQMLWTILHEIGHYITQNDLTEKEEAQSTLAKGLCALIPKEIAINNKRLQNIYFNSPIEWYATEWAIDWVMVHYCQAVRISKNLESLR